MGGKGQQSNFKKKGRKGIGQESLWREGGRTGDPRGKTDKEAIPQQGDKRRDKGCPFRTVQSPFRGEKSSKRDKVKKKKARCETASCREMHPGPPQKPLKKKMMNEKEEGDEQRELADPPKERTAPKGRKTGRRAAKPAQRV